MQFRRMSKSFQFVVMVISVTMVGLLVGWIDIHIHDAYCEPAEIGIYFLACAALGFIRPKWLWLWPFILAFTLYAVHVWAIRHGYKQPFVEKNEEYAIDCIFLFAPCLLGGVIGGSVRLVTGIAERIDGVR